MLIRTCRILLFFISLFLTTEIYSQKGQYISVFGAYQYTNLANVLDHWYSTYSYTDTYYPSIGLKYTCNFTNIFGIETGIKYSYQGQKYKGSLSDSNVNFSSRVNLNYIQIPLMLSINSSLLDPEKEADKFYFSFNAGVQFEFLSQSSMTVSPPPTYPPQYASSDFNKLFAKFNASVIAELRVNISLYKNLSLITGLYASKTMNDIEDKSFQFDPNKDPLEYAFPVSVKKESLPDETSRYKTTFLVYGISLGLSYKIK